MTPDEMQARIAKLEGHRDAWRRWAFMIRDGLQGLYDVRELYGTPEHEKVAEHAAALLRWEEPEGGA